MDLPILASAGRTNVLTSEERKAHCGERKLAED
jgi:hypothetical protein